VTLEHAEAFVSASQITGTGLVLQLSENAVKYHGSLAPLGAAMIQIASAAETPIVVHLDHATSRQLVTEAINLGFTSVMFDGSALPFKENIRQTKMAYDLTTEAGVGLEAEIGAIGGTEDDKFVAEDDAILAVVDDCVEFCRNFPDLAVFAPAIGTAHGVYKGEPKIAYDRLEEITSLVDIPIALHGGTGLSPDQFSRCIKSGCAKVNISTMHKLQFIEGFTALKKDKPNLGEPIPFIDAQYEQMKSGVKDMIALFSSAGKA